MCARAYVRVRVRMRMRACVRVCVRVSARVYVRAWVRGHGPRCQCGDLSEVDSSLDIVAWRNCCMCNYMGMG